MISQITFRSDDVFTDRFGREVVEPLNGGFSLWQRFEVERYLEYHGDKLVRRFDANTYLLADQGDGPARHRSRPWRHRGGARAHQGAGARRSASARTSCIPRTSRARSSTRRARAGGDAEYVELDSPHGHDAFLLEFDQVGEALTEFLDESGEGWLTTPIRSGGQRDRARSAPDARYNDESLAPVLWPSTTYFNRSVDEQFALARSVHPGKFYSRNGSPTVLEFEDAVAALEGAEAALAFGSGMGAIASVVLTFCGTGDHVVAQSRTFSVTNQLFTMLCPRLGIDVTFVDATDTRRGARRGAPGQDAARVRRDARATPGSSVVDLDAIGAIQGSVHGRRQHVRTAARAADARRTASTSCMHAATKGSPDTTTRCSASSRASATSIEAVWGHHLMHGAVCSPFDAWNALRGIRTLHARVRQQSETAHALAEFLEAHPAVARVRVSGTRLASRSATWPSGR